MSRGFGGGRGGRGGYRGGGGGGAFHGERGYGGGGGGKMDPFPDRGSDRYNPMGGGRGRGSFESTYGRRPLPMGREPLPMGREPLPMRREPLPMGREPLPMRREPLPMRRDPLHMGREPLPMRREPLPMGREPLPPPMGRGPPLGRGPPMGREPPPIDMYEEELPIKKNYKKLKVQPCNNEEDKKSCYVVNIPDYATPEQLRLFFGQCGEVANVTMPKDHSTGFHRGMAFIRFEHEDETYFAVDAMQGKEMRPESGYEPDYDELGNGVMFGPPRLSNKPLVVKLKEGEECVVHMENLPESMTPGKLKNVLAKYGKPKEPIFMPKNSRTGFYRGAALVTFEFNEEATDLVKELDKKVLKYDGKSYFVTENASADSQESPKTIKLEVSICEDGCTLQVGSIPAGYSAKVLEAMFSPYGSLAEEVDYSELRNRATVKFESEDAAASAADALNGSEIEVTGTKDENMAEANGDQKSKKKKLTVKLAHNESSNRTAFVTNIPKVYNQDDIREIFGEFGDILDVNIARDKNKQPRGMCFIKFEKEEDTNNFIEKMNEKEIDVRIVFDPYTGYYHDLPPLRKKKLSVKTSTQSDNYVHISNLPKSITTDELTKLLTPYGNLEKEVIIPLDKITGFPRGFTLACFENVEQAEACIEGLNGREMVEDEDTVRDILIGDHQPQGMDGMHDRRYNEPAFARPGFDRFGYDGYHDDFYDPMYPPARRGPPPNPLKLITVKRYNADYHKNVPQGESNTTVWVGNIPQYMSNQELDDVFSRFGTIVMKINRPRDKFTGLFKEHTFIRYKTKEEAEAALEHMNRSPEERGFGEQKMPPHRREAYGHEQDSPFWSDDPPQESGHWQRETGDGGNASTAGLVNALSSLNKICGYLGLLGPSLRSAIEQALDVGHNTITILGVFQDTETQGMLELVEMKLRSLENKAQEASDPHGLEMFTNARKHVERLKNPRVMMH